MHLNRAADLNEPLTWKHSGLSRRFKDQGLRQAWRAPRCEAGSSRRPRETSAECSSRKSFTRRRCRASAVDFACFTRPAEVGEHDAGQAMTAITALTIGQAHRLLQQVDSQNTAVTGNQQRDAAEHGPRPNVFIT